MTEDDCCCLKSKKFYLTLIPLTLILFSLLIPTVFAQEPTGTEGGEPTTPTEPPATGGEGGGTVEQPPATGGEGGGTVEQPPATGGEGGGTTEPQCPDFSYKIDDCKRQNGNPIVERDERGCGFVARCDMPSQPPTGGGGGEGCICPEYYDPVCGTNGRTYGNDCSAKCEGMEVAYRGECKAQPPTACPDIEQAIRKCKDNQMDYEVITPRTPDACPFVECREREISCEEKCKREAGENWQKAEECIKTQCGFGGCPDVSMEIRKCKEGGGMPELGWDNRGCQFLRGCSGMEQSCEGNCKREFGDNWEKADQCIRERCGFRECPDIQYDLDKCNKYGGEAEIRGDERGCKFVDCRFEGGNESCEMKCKEKYRGDDIGALKCMQADCGRKLECKEMCLVKHGGYGEETERCVRDECQFTQTCPDLQYDIDKCKEHGGKPDFRMDERGCQYLECRFKQDYSCEEKCMSEFKDDMKAQIKCKAHECGQGVGCEEKCFIEFDDPTMAEKCMESECNRYLNCEEKCFLQAGGKTEEAYRCISDKCGIEMGCEQKCKMEYGDNVGEALRCMADNCGRGMSCEDKCITEYGDGTEKAFRCMDEECRGAQPRCPPEEDIERRAIECQQQGGTTDEFTDEWGCFKIICQFGDASQCSSKDELRRMSENCFDLGLEPHWTRSMVNGCEAVECVEPRGERCDVTYEMKKEMQEKCGEEGVREEFNEEGCPILVCGRPEECIKIPREAEMKCRERGGEFIVEEENGCARDFFCVDRPNDKDIKYRPVDEIPDPTKLLAIALRLEEVKIELDKLARKTNSIADYYKSTGDTASEERFRKAAAMFDGAKDRIDDLKIKIRDSAESMDRDILEGIMHDLEYFKEVVLKEILYMLLSTDKEVVSKDVKECSDERCMGERMRMCQPATFYPDDPDPYVKEVRVDIQGMEDNKCVFKVTVTHPMGTESMTCKMSDFGFGPPSEEDMIKYCEGPLVERMKEGPPRGRGPPTVEEREGFREERGRGPEEFERPRQEYERVRVDRATPIPMRTTVSEATEERMPERTRIARELSSRGIPRAERAERAPMAERAEEVRPTTTEARAVAGLGACCIEGVCSPTNEKNCSYAGGVWHKGKGCYEIEC